jgi:hypothetical protein
MHRSRLKGPLIDCNTDDIAAATRRGWFVTRRQ